MRVQLHAFSGGTPGRVLTTPSTGTLTRRTATAVVSGTEAATAMRIAFSHERNVRIDASRHQALVRVNSDLFVYDNLYISALCTFKC